MIKLEGGYILPNHLISKVFIRGNRVYYNDANSRIKNVFTSVPSDEIRDPFARISILRYLYDRRLKTVAHKDLLAYVKTSELIGFLSSHGHDEFRIIEEIKSLLNFNLIENESQNSELFNIQDLIKITSSGTANVEMVRNIDYLAAVAEDIWYKDNRFG
jgi:hypothetical protein